MNEEEKIDLLKGINTLMLHYYDAIQRVRELHQPVKDDYSDDLKCDECIEAAGWNAMQSDYPCDTIKALDGEQ